MRYHYTAKKNYLVASLNFSHAHHLRVRNGGVVDGVVGEDVSPVVDLLQSQVHHWDGS